MLVLGIDPGTHRCGFSIVESVNSKINIIDCGVFDTLEKEKIQNIKRLYKIKIEVLNLINKYKPQALSIESLFINKNYKTAISIGEVRGVVMITAYENNINVFEYTPLQIKRALTGNGTATKEQVAKMIKLMCNTNNIPKSDDATDAIACAICHLHSANLMSVLYKIQYNN